jgi:uncharacterized protein
MTVSINMGSGCNFRCKYCFEVKNGAVEKPIALREDVKKRTIEILHLLEDIHDLRIEFWGGEPSVYFKDIKDIIDEFVDNEDVSFFMYTNGSLVEKYKKELLEIHDKVGERFEVQVSYDYQNIENNQRLQLNKTVEETDEMVRNAIKFFDENDFMFGTKTTCTMKDLEENLFDMYMNYEKLNEELKHKVAFVCTPDTLGSGDVDYKKMHEQFIQLISYFLKNKKNKPTGFLWFDQNANIDCVGGTNSFQIDVDGRVTYCHGCLYMNEKMFYTNIFEDNFLHKVDYNYLVSNSLFEKPEQCLNCNSVFCFRCNASNSKGNPDNWNKPNKPELCKLYKKISDYIKAYRRVK